MLEVGDIVRLQRRMFWCADKTPWNPNFDIPHDKFLRDEIFEIIDIRSPYFYLRVWNPRLQKFYSNVGTGDNFDLYKKISQ